MIKDALDDEFGLSEGELDLTRRILGDKRGDKLSLWSGGKLGGELMEVISGAKLGEILKN